MNKEEKEYIVSIYYKYKEKTVKELREKLNISSRAFGEIAKEYKIPTQRRNRYTLNEDYFEQIDSEEKAYILGLIYADGFLGEEPYNNLVLNLIDKELLVRVASAIEFSGEIRKCKRGGFENSKESYSLNFSSAKIATDLRKHGVYQKKSLSLSNLPNLNEGLKRHFLRGYFDGDGTISMSINRRKYKGKEYQYLKAVMLIIATEPFIKELIKEFKITSYNIANSKTPEMKYLRISKKDELFRFYQLFYKESTIYLDRKKTKWDEVMSALA